MPEPTEEDVVRTALRSLLAEAAAARPPESPEALRARSGRRTVRLPDPKLMVALVAAVVLVVVLVTAGALHQSSRQPTPVHRTGGDAFSIRPVLCFAAPFQESAEPMPHGTALPPCSPESALTAASLGIEPGGGDATGYTSNLPSAPTDDSFASVPSTAASQVTPSTTVLLPGAPGSGSTRYVLGPAGVTGVDVASATVHSLDGGAHPDADRFGGVGHAGPAAIPRPRRCRPARPRALGAGHATDAVRLHVVRRPPRHQRLLHPGPGHRRRRRHRRVGLTEGRPLSDSSPPGRSGTLTS
jgi:hypothetical protein